MTLTQQGTVDVAALIVGDWSVVGFEYNSVEYPIGNVPEGTLEIGREYYRHQGTQLPRRVDAVFLITTSMRFTGTVEECHERNMRFALGKDPSVLTDYIYIGAAEIPSFFTFTARRFRPSDNALIEAKIWKALLVSTFSLAGGDETVGTPLEVEGLDDSAGNYGGSAAAPLGYLYVPDPTP